MRRAGMIKLLHTADIHLDSPLRSLALRDRELQNTVQAATRAVFRKIVDLALAENIDALLLAGDVFDSERRSAQSLAFLTLQLEKLQQAGIAVFYIKGNHDAENPLTDMMDWPNNVTIFSGRGQSIRLHKTAPDGRPVYIHGVSFSGRQASNLLSKFPNPVPHSINIGLLHTSLNGAAGHDVYAPCSVSELAAKGYDYWALGHIHKRAVYEQSGSLIVMPGTPQGRDIGEDGEKSVTLVEIDSGGALTAKEYYTGSPAFYRLPITVEGLEDAAAIRGKIRAALQNLKQRMKAPAAVARLILQGRTALHWQLMRDHDYWRNIAAETAEGLGNLWIDRLELQVIAAESESVSAEQKREDALPAAELAKMMRQAAEQPQMQAECLKILGKISDFLPVEMRSLLSANSAESASATKKFLHEGSEYMTALLESYDGQRDSENNETGE